MDIGLRYETAYEQQQRLGYTDSVVCTECGVFVMNRAAHDRHHAGETGTTTEAVADPSGMVTIPRYELDQLLATATVYVEAFEPDEMMTLPGIVRLQEVEAVLEKYGKRY